MSAQRKAIRARLRDLLTGTTAAGANVSDMPLNLESLRAVDLPAIGIWIADDVVSYDDARNAPIMRTHGLSVAVEAVVAPGDDVADKIDDICQQIDDILTADEYLGGEPRQYTDSVRLMETRMEALATGEQMTGYAGMMFMLEYISYSPRTDNQLVPLLEVQATYDPGADPGDRPRDDIEVIGA